MISIQNARMDRIANINYGRRASELYASDGVNIRFEIIEGAGRTFSRKYDAITIEMLKQFAGTGETA